MNQAMRRLCKLCLLAAFFVLAPPEVLAQTIAKGQVFDSTNEPVIGATVVEKGSPKNATVTDFEGNFELKLQNSKQVVITFIGMKPKTVAASTNMKVMMEDDNNTLNELVVIGYGAVRKKDLTGSVVTVAGQDLAKVPVSNVTEALTGKMAGVNITTTDGSPDAEVLIRVRGGGSITGDNSPLVVIDGFQGGKLTDLSPNDIEDITVLKDASSTAIYGSEGANGVI